MKIQFPATVSKISTLSDGSLRLQIDTQELSNEEKAKAFDTYNKIGWWLFAEQPMKEEDIKDLPEIQEFKNDKSLSERLRNTLFVYHTKRGGKIEDFEFYRKKYMEQKIEELKNKIRELE